MAISQKPLNFDPKRLTLKQLKRFMQLAGKQDTPESIDEFERLLVAASDWSYDELEQVTARDLEALIAAVGAQVQEANADAVPPQIMSASSGGLLE